MQENPLIVALDVPDIAHAERLVDQIGDGASIFKIGYQLAPVGGFDLAQKLIASGRKVFFDLKYHDIGATVEKGVRSIASLGGNFLTVHAEKDVLSAAMRGKGEAEQLNILAVTVLTSLSQADLHESGYDIALKDLVLKRARRARDAGADGIVASALEAADIRREVGPDMLIITPGVRPQGAATGDEKRVVTPENAILAGANYIVVGRPITEAADPGRAAKAIAEEAMAAVARA